MKKVCHMSNEDRQFVLKLLHITKDDFERAFQDLAKSDSIKGKRKFAAYWCELAELAFTEAENEDNNEQTDIREVLAKYNETFDCVIPERVRVSSVSIQNVKKCLKCYGISGVEKVFDQVRHEYLSEPKLSSVDFSTIFQFGHFSSLLNRYFERRFKKGGEV